MDLSVSPSFTRAALTAAAFIALLGWVILIARLKKVPLPFTTPPLVPVLKWTAIFLVAAIFQEVTGALTSGGEGAQDWEALTPARMLRAATIVLLAPLAEEVAFRGTLYGDLERRRMHPAVVVLLPALIFTLVHFQYSGLGLSYIFIDGVIFGLARRHTNSILTPIMLHMLGNAFAVAERIL